MSDAIHHKEVFCDQLEIGQRVDEVFCLSRVERRQRSNGEPFLRLVLVDRSGEVNGVAWDDVDALLEVLEEGGYARIRGDVGDFRGELQVKVTGAEPAGRIDPAEYLARSPVPVEASMAGIRRLVDTVEDPPLKRLLDGFLADPEFAAAFAAAPAAKANHHAYVGGLAEHTLSVMEMCDRAADHYPGVDRDLLLAGAFCHDIGKTVELAVEPGFPYTEQGELLGHIPLGFAMVRERAARIEGFPVDRATDLGHLVLSHQGQLDWGSPVQPRTLEAIVLHFVDNMDSKVATAKTHLAGVESGRTAYVRALGRTLFRRAPTEAEPGPVPVEEGSGTGPPGDAPPAERAAAPDSPSLFDEMDAAD